jgi:hypothetical protein
MIKCSLLLFIIANIFAIDVETLQEIIVESDVKYQIKMKNCSEKICPSPNSYCVSSHICQCSNMFAHSGDNICDYERKLQIFAFLLEAIFSFGIGHLYCMRIEYGSLKFLLQLILVMTYVYYRYSGHEFKFNNETYFDCLISIIVVLWTSLFMILHIYDLTMFSINRFKDGAGISLLSWNDKSY